MTARQQQQAQNKAALVQAAGHGLLRLDPDRDTAIVKPTTRQECVTYECIAHDESMRNFRPFVPRYFASWPLEVVVPGSKFTHEVSLENLCRLDASDADLLHWCGLVDTETGETLSSSSSSSSSPPRSSSSSSSPILYQSPPCVLDLKLGRFRHTKATPLRKYMRQMRKDSPTTARSVGLRVCGVKHCRLLSDAVFDHDDGEEQDDQADGDRKRRSQRRQQILKKQKEFKKAGDSDSEIMQLPKATEQQQQTLMMKRQESTASSVAAGDTAVMTPTASTTFDGSSMTLQWTEDKILGRNATPLELLEALAMFCTVRVTSDAATGRVPLCADDKSAPLRFDPHPEQALLEYFRGRVRRMLEVVERDGILERYTFASASLLFVHRFTVRRDDGASNRRFVLEVDADLRLVDFSSSGPIDSEIARISIEHNAALAKNAATPLSSPCSLSPIGVGGGGAAAAAAAAASPTSTDDGSQPTSPSSPSAFSIGHVPLFDDDVIEFKFGLDNLSTALDQLCSVTQELAKKMSARKSE